FQELTAGKTLSILREWRILIAIDLRQPGPLWSAKLAQSYAAADRLSEVYAASVCGRRATGPEAGRRVAVGGDRVDPEGMDSSASPRCAAVAGFSLHANVAISFHDRPRLERLFRYAARPPLSMDRLEALPDGRLRYWFKTPWRNGTTYAIFEPLEFLEKLAALVPTPRAHLVRFHGLLAPAAKWRPAVVPNTAIIEPPLDSPDISTIT